MAAELIADCAEKEGGTPEDVKHILGRNMPTKKIHKCISACVGESVGLVSLFRLNKIGSLKFNA